MGQYAIQITRLNYTYPDGTRALEEIDLDLRIGERVALVGPSGAGKSTLLLHLNGILTGTGTVRILGKVLDGENLREIRRHVGLVFQDPDDQLFCPTVFEDIAFGPMNLGIDASEVQGRVSDALRSVDLDPSFNRRSSHHLSHGERKRVALATVLAMRPSILALDEPTSNLDPRNRRHFIELVNGLDSTLILATHDLEMVKWLCPRTVVMDHGKIWADGHTSKLLNDAQLLHARGLS
jgi:cobalt/nickel transport system ATP-binding protein